MDSRINFALVSGAARGIGRAIAWHLGRHGVQVAIHYRSSKADATSLLNEIRDTSPGSFLVQGDLTDDVDAARICHEVLQRFGRIDVVVNNIGNYLRKDLTEMSFAEWRDQIESNLYTTFLTCHHLVPSMTQQGFGRIINIGYAASQQALYNRKTVPYHIAKTGVHILTRSLAAMVAADGVTVNCLGMGVIENSVLVPDEIPAGRPGHFEDVLNALDFLLKTESAYINGTQIDVSGGWIPEQIL